MPILLLCVPESAVMTVPGIKTKLLFITTVPITKLFAWRRGILEVMSMRYDEPRRVWTSLPITH
jgi:hypothetical protein